MSVFLNLAIYLAFHPSSPCEIVSHIPDPPRMWIPEMRGPIPLMSIPRGERPTDVGPANYRHKVPEQPPCVVSQSPSRPPSSR